MEAQNHFKRSFFQEKDLSKVDASKEKRHQQIETFQHDKDVWMSRLMACRIQLADLQKEIFNLVLG